MTRYFNLLFLLSWAIIPFSCHTPGEKADELSTPRPPNIVLIIADDMAWDDSGAYGHPHIQTPNIDKLAHEGMKFTNAFLTTSSCSPSRSSIITGRYPHQTGAEQLHMPLPGDQVTFVEKLREAGYWTAQAGKWHLGNAVKERFNLLAEDSVEVLLTDQMDSVEQEFLRKGDGSGCHLWVSLLQHRPMDKPFFLWLAATDPHRGYREGAIPKPHVPGDALIPPYIPDTEEVRKDFALYYDEISRLDSYVGRVMDELDRQGVAENTLILFISDNGRPFPRCKTTLYDGGIKTPWIVRWPARVPGESVSEALVSSVDIARSFLSVAGLTAGETFMGKDFIPVLSHPDTAIREFIIGEDHWHDHDDYTRAVRSSTLKYIKNYYPELPNTPPADALKGGTYLSMEALRAEGKLDSLQLSVYRTPRPVEELYDIKHDPHELNNLALVPDFADSLQKMRGILEEFRQSTGDKLPAQRTPDRFSRNTGDRIQ